MSFYIHQSNRLNKSLFKAAIISILFGLLYAQNLSVLSGEGMAPIMHNDVNSAIVQAKKNAMSDLATQIKVQIHSEFLHSLAESQTGIDEYTKSKINLISDLEIDGVRFVVNQGKDYVQVKALLDKDEAKKLYLGKCQTLKKEIEQRFSNAQYFLKAGKRQAALSELIRASRLMDGLEQAKLIYFAVGGPVNEALNSKVTHAQIDKEITQLLNAKNRSFNEAVNNLAIQLVQLIPNHSVFRVKPFLYEDKNFGSAFSEYLRQELASALSKNVPSNTIKKISQREIIIQGTYWLHPESMVILAQLQDHEGQLLGSARTEIPLKYINRLGMAYLPPNINQALEDENLLDESQLVYGNLILHVWTNRGVNSLLFKQGEQMKIYVRANTPAYIRCIYHLANGKRTPLVDNFYINLGMVNKTVEITKGFNLVCAPPFGVERLQIFASTRKFPPLKTRHEIINGQEYEVLAEPFQKFVTQARGFIKQPGGEEETPERKYAERVITVTTIPAH